MPLRIRRIEPVSVRPVKMPCFLCGPAPTAIELLSPVARLSQAWRTGGTPSSCQRLIQLRKCRPKCSIRSMQAISQPSSARRGAPGPVARLVVLWAALRGEAVADDDPVRDVARLLGARARHAHAADHAAIDLDPVRPAEGQGHDRRQQRAERVAQAQHRHQHDRQGILERVLGRQHHRGLASILADAPQHRAGLGTLGRDAAARARTDRCRASPPAVGTTAASPAAHS